MCGQLEIRGVDGELKKAAEAAIGMKPNFAYTLKEVAADMHHVFDLGYFSKATPTPEDTRDGVKLIIEVFPNPNLQRAGLAAVKHCGSLFIGRRRTAVVSGCNASVWS